MTILIKKATPAKKINRLTMEKLVPVLLVRRSERVPSTFMYLAGFLIVFIMLMF